MKKLKKGQIVDSYVLWQFLKSVENSRCYVRISINGTYAWVKRKWFRNCGGSFKIDFEYGHSKDIIYVSAS